MQCLTRIVVTNLKLFRCVVVRFNLLVPGCTLLELKHFHISKLETPLTPRICWGSFETFKNYVNVIKICVVAILRNKFTIQTGVIKKTSNVCIM